MTGFCSHPGCSNAFDAFKVDVHHGVDIIDGFLLLHSSRSKTLPIMHRFVLTSNLLSNPEDVSELLCTMCAMLPGTPSAVHGVSMCANSVFIAARI